MSILLLETLVPLKWVLPAFCFYMNGRDVRRGYRFLITTCFSNVALPTVDLEKGSEGVGGERGGGEEERGEKRRKEEKRGEKRRKG